MGIDLSKSIVIDQHAHSLLKGHLHLDALAFRESLSESRSLTLLQDHAPSAVYYLDLINKLCAFLGIESSEKAVLEHRSRQREGAYLQKLWDDASIGAVILDDGYRTTEMLSINQLASESGRPIYRCRRIETTLEDALVKAHSFTELSNLFMRSLTESTQGTVVALKTIAAYRGGLEIELTSSHQARNDFDRLKSLFRSGAGTRITRSSLYHYFLLQAFEVAAAKELPVQVHTGVGDSDEDLRYANPLCLHEILHAQAFAKTNFVFLHCYPYHKEAAYLCSIYPNAYMDLSLAVSVASPISADMVLDALAIAPSSKILAGSDGHSIPESHWHGIKLWKEALSISLEKLVSQGRITLDQAQQIASRVLYDNARKLYSLDSLS